MTDISADEITSLEEIANENGMRFWYAHIFAEYLGYKDFNSFLKVIRKSMVTCDNIGISTDSEFIQAEFKGKITYKLSRFACFLCVSNADEKNRPMVSKAKVVLAKFADLSLKTYEQIERINKRRKLSDDERIMDEIACKQGLDSSDFGRFKDSGYRGMYNMGIKQLKKHKHVVDSATLYDFMGRTELAANSLRAILTAENIKMNNITQNLSMFKAAKDVGEQVREIVIKNTGIKPEDIPIEEKINVDKKTIKQVRNKMIVYDQQKKIGG